MDNDQLGLFCGPKKEPVSPKVVQDYTPWFELPFFALDVETTGLKAATDRVIELSLVPFNMSPSLSPISELFSVPGTLSKEITRITGISDDMLVDKPNFSERYSKFLELLSEVSFVVAYNAKFDQPFLESEFARIGEVMPDIKWVDPFVFICSIDKYKKGKKLQDAAQRWGVSLSNAHRAEDDARAAGELMLKLADKINEPNLKILLKKQTILQWEQERSRALYRQSNSWSVNR